MHISQPFVFKDKNTIIIIGIHADERIWLNGGNCNYTETDEGGSMNDCITLCLCKPADECHAILFGDETEESVKNECTLLKCTLKNGTVPLPTVSGSPKIGVWIDPGNSCF